MSVTCPVLLLEIGVVIALLWTLNKRVERKKESLFSKKSFEKYSPDISKRVFSGSQILLLFHITDRIFISTTY